MIYINSYISHDISLCSWSYQQEWYGMNLCNAELQYSNKRVCKSPKWAGVGQSRFFKNQRNINAIRVPLYEHSQNPSQQTKEIICQMLTVTTASCPDVEGNSKTAAGWRWAPCTSVLSSSEGVFRCWELAALAFPPAGPGKGKATDSVF